MNLFNRVINKILLCSIGRKIPDKLYLKIQYRIYMGKKLNLKNPKSYNEKLQWLKLYNRRKEYVSMADKYDVREYVRKHIGEEYLIPCYGVWERFDDIDFDKLPEQFVLKCTHDSGSVIICKDKSSFDKQKAKEKLERKMKLNLYWGSREWVYRDLKPRIIAEKYMEDSKTQELRDYKFFCFDGKAEMLFVATDRPYDTRFDFFDRDFNNLHIKNGHENATKKIEKPECFDEMKQLADRLSEGFPHVRIDFYEVDGKVYFGEFTFFHFCGIIPFEPEEWDYKLGEKIDNQSFGKKRNEALFQLTDMSA